MAREKDKAKYMDRCRLVGGFDSGSVWKYYSNVIFSYGEVCHTFIERCKWVENIESLRREEKVSNRKQVEWENEHTRDM